MRSFEVTNEAVMEKDEDGKDTDKVLTPATIARRAVKLPPLKNEVQACLGCKRPMYVAPGTIAYYHKECRTKARGNKRARQIKAVQLGSPDDPMAQTIDDAIAKSGQGK